MKQLLYIISLFFLISCSLSSKKGSEDEEKQKRSEQARKERIIEENKRFEFLCELISYKTNISQDTVIIIAKEFYQQYEYAIFEGNKIVNINYSSQIIEPKNYNFVENIIKHYQLPRKDVFLIFYEIDLYYKLEYMESTIDDIDCAIYSIDEKIEEKRNR